MTLANDHEYAVLGGVSRTDIGRYLTLASSTVSGALVFVVLQAVDLAKTLGWNVNLPPTLLSLVGAGAVYAGLSWILKHYAWKWGPLAKVLKVPDLAGTWDCQGETLDQDGNVKYRWQAEVAIVQCWDKLRIRLKTKDSGSNSLAAALTSDSIEGWRLLYQYQNDPKIGRPDLHAHVGCAAVTIAKDLKTATAEYFNGVGRASFGRMTWTRRA